MTLEVIEREQIIYSPGIQADCIYFVKEGVVLL
jgi:CRP-like cAMP-binding protein